MLPLLVDRCDFKLNSGICGHQNALAHFNSHEFLRSQTGYGRNVHQTTFNVQHNHYMSITQTHTHKRTDSQVIYQTRCRYRGKHIKESLTHMV